MAYQAQIRRCRCADLFRCAVSTAGYGSIPSIETAQLENEMSELGGLLCNHPGGVRLNHIESNEHPPPPGAQN